MSDQQSGAAQPAISSQGVNGAVGGLTQLIMSLPVWIRAVIALIIVIGGGWIVYSRYVPQNQDAQTRIQPTIGVGDSGQYLRSAGVPDPSHPNPTDPQTQEASHKAAEDSAAAQYHFVHRDDDDPPEVALQPDSEQSNSFHYRYFVKTDRCLFIDRIEDGKHYTQWLKDPHYHFHDIDQTVGQYSSHAAIEPRDTVPAGQFVLPFRFIPALLGVLPARTHLNAEPVQAGFCVNPHPGQFRYWWGPPLDQCNSPMYRQFADGCIHYQVYNRCANAWDSRINWTVCNRPPHH